jgi:hypothetical protein
LVGKGRLAFVLVVAAGLVAVTGLGPRGAPIGADPTPPPAKEAKAAEAKPAEPPTDDKAVAGRVVDPDGKPLAGVRASRLTEHSLWTTDPLPTETFEVRQVTESRPRAVLLWHEDRKLGAMIRPKVGDPAPDVRLKPNGSAAGRLLTVDGTPAADQPLDVMFKLPGDSAWGPWFARMKVRTDAAGRFDIPNLPEGPEFSVRYADKRSPNGGRFAREFRVTSGKATDLGNVKPR